MLSTEQAAAERARKEVLFWKDQLDHAVNEKNSLLDRYTELYRHSFQLEQAVVTLNTENTELRHVLDRTVGLHDERRTVGGPATPTSGSGASGASTPVSNICQQSLCPAVGWAHIRSCTPLGPATSTVVACGLLFMSQASLHGINC